MFFFSNFEIRNIHEKKFSEQCSKCLRTFRDNFDLTKHKCSMSNKIWKKTEEKAEEKTEEKSEEKAEEKIGRKTDTTDSTINDILNSSSSSSTSGSSSSSGNSKKINNKFWCYEERDSVSENEEPKPEFEKAIDLIVIFKKLKKIYILRKIWQFDVSHLENCRNVYLSHYFFENISESDAYRL